MPRHNSGKNMELTVEETDKRRAALATAFGLSIKDVEIEDAKAALFSFGGNTYQVVTGNVMNALVVVGEYKVFRKGDVTSTVAQRPTEGQHPFRAVPVVGSLPSWTSAADRANASLLGIINASASVVRATTLMVENEAGQIEDIDF